jgi:regulator of protease activity HflC (stomatin/prohibitin superfamily)
MSERFRVWLDSVRRRLSRWRFRRYARAEVGLQARGVADVPGFDLHRAAWPLAVVALAVVSAGLLVRHPPVQGIGRGDVGVRINTFSGTTTEWSEGSVFVVPALHQLRVLSLRDRSHRPAAMSRADGPAPLQSVEGLSLGVDLTVRYAVDPLKAAASAKSLPDDIGAEIVDPAAQGVVYKVFARYTVREIFSTQRAAIQQAIEAELKPRLAADGLLLRSVQIGKIDLPADYRRGMETLLAEELATEKMRYTLDLKDKRVKETELDAKAEKVRREIGAEAAGREQVIAAKAQEEAMKHVLPFKQRQIEQRQLEAEAAKVTRIKAAEASAQARRIEAGGEAEARQKLADAEVYRMERVGKAGAEQMGREGLLITRHPLLIQKTLADKLSDKIQVIIAAPPTDGGFIGSALLGGPKRTSLAAGGVDEEQHAASAADAKEAP